MYPEFPNHQIVKAPYSGNISNCLEYDFPMVFPYGWMNCTQLFLVFFPPRVLSENSATMANAHPWVVTLLSQRCTSQILLVKKEISTLELSVFFTSHSPFVMFVSHHLCICATFCNCFPYNIYVNTASSATRG